MSKIKVTFNTRDGASTVVEVPVGVTLMQAARFYSDDGYINGISADCGGCQSCGTCHVIIDESWIDKVGKYEKSSLEDELIYYENGDVSTENSRLSCQVVLKKKHDGLIVRVP